jgi:hypothetical protein
MRERPGPVDSIRHTTTDRFDDERLWQLEDVADAAREVPLEDQPDRLRAALATLVLSTAATRSPRPPAQR